MKHVEGTSHTYTKWNKEKEALEFFGYGADNESMNTAGTEYFERIQRDDSFFKKNVLHLKNVCWMNPFAIIEGVPGGKHYDISMIHCMLAHCNIDGKVNVFTKPAGAPDTDYVSVASLDFPFAEDKWGSREVLNIEYVTDFHLEVDSDVKLEVAS